MQAERFARLRRDAGLKSRFRQTISKVLRLLRDRAPAAMEIAAGEYGYDIFYFRRMLAAGAVDVQQADVTRCGGITGFLQVAALCQAHNMPLSAHTAPALHTHVACAVNPSRTWNTSTIMCALRACCSMACRSWSMESFVLICRGPESGLNSSVPSTEVRRLKENRCLPARFRSFRSDELKNSIASRPPDWRSAGRC